MKKELNETQKLFNDSIMSSFPKADITEIRHNDWEECGKHIDIEMSLNSTTRLSSSNIISIARRYGYNTTHQQFQILDKTLIYTLWLIN